MEKILILANHYNTLRIFRRELIKELVARNNEVVICIPKTDEINIEILRSYGCEIEIIDMDRRGMNPLKDMYVCFKYIQIMKKLKPTKVITYTIKSNIYGSLAARILGIAHYANVTGLGSAFQIENYTKKIIIQMYRVALTKADKVFFENIGNKQVFIEHKIVRESQAVVMAGAGVNLDEFQFCEYPNQDILKILFVGRIMKEKGVEELFYAIKKIKAKYNFVCFEFIGWYEDNYREIVGQLEKDNFITYHGFQTDVRPYIREAHCIVLPSYHEGMSNTLLEGAAMGRPLITSDIHGCKEAVIDGKNGLLCRVKDEKHLFNKIEKFILLKDSERIKMGIESRELMINRFDKNHVVDKTIMEIFKV